MSVPPSESLIALKRREVGVEEGVAAVRADVDVEGAGRRGRVDPGERRGADAGEAVLDLRGGPAWARAAAARAPRTISAGTVVRSISASPSSFGWPGQRLRAPWPVDGARSGAGSRRGVEQDGGDVHAGDAVDERVVGLGDQREAPAGHALHEPDLPQRLGAIQALGEEPPGQALERGVVGRLAAGRCGGCGSRG